MPDDFPTPGPASTPQAGPVAAPGRRGLLLAGAGGVAAAAGMGLAWWRQPAGPPSGQAPGSAAASGDDALATMWAMSLVRPEGGELAMASLRGKPLLINFWATWCAPCIRELPQIDRFHREFGPRGWQVLGLAIDGPTPVREFLARVKLGFPIGLGGLDGTDLLHSLGNLQGGLPFSVMIGAGGQVLQRKMGETSFDELAGWAARG